MNILDDNLRHLLICIRKKESQIHQIIQNHMANEDFLEYSCSCVRSISKIRHYDSFKDL